MAQYPGAAGSDATLFIAKNNLSTVLNGAINAVVTTITVNSTVGFPTTGYITIEAEAISYTGTNATQFTGCTRGADGTTAASHADLLPVLHTVVAAHHNTLKDEIIAIETDLVSLQASITPVAATDTATSVLNRVAMIVQQIKTGFSLTNWYDTVTAAVLVAGTQTINGLKTFGSLITAPSVTLTNTTNQIVLGTTNTTTITSPAPAASRTVTVPDALTNSEVMLTEGTQTINGVKTVKSSSLKLQEASSTDTVTVAVASLAADRTYTVPDAGGAADFVMTAGSQSITGVKTIDSSSLQLKESGGGSDVITVAVDSLATGLTYTIRDAGAAASFGLTTDSTHPVTTAWTAYTPTFTGLGTVSNVEFFWKQTGDTLSVQGAVLAGTVAAATFSLTLPSGKTIDYTKMPDGIANIALNGEWYGLQTGGLIANSAFGPTFSDGSSTTLVFAALNATGGAGFTKVNGNGMILSNQYICLKFEVAIS